MITFWIISALLILVALAILAPSLLKSRQSISLDRNQQNVVIAQERLAEMEADLANGVIDQGQFDQSRRELEQSLLLDLDEDEETQPAAPKGQGRLALGILAVAVPLLTVSLYLFLGSPQMVAMDAAMQSAHQGVPGSEGKMPSVDEMMTALVDRLKGNPEDPEGWYLLGRTYMVMKDYPKAAEAYDRVLQLVGDDPSIMLSLADALAMSQQGDLTGRPAELVRRAVELAPDDATALWLGGMVEDQSGNTEKALAHWRRLKPMLDDDPQSLQQVEQLIARAEQRLPAAAEAVSPVVESAGNGGEAAASAIDVHIELSAELKDYVEPEETVFVYARAVNGPRFPLAALRFKVKDLPLDVTLDDSSAMRPEARLSNFSEVVVGARVSRSGDAIAKSGDLRGELSPVSVSGAGKINITIDTMIP